VKVFDILIHRGEPAEVSANASNMLKVFATSFLLRLD